MRRILQLLLYRPVIWFVNRYSTRPDPKRVAESLTNLHNEIAKGSLTKGPLIPFDPSTDRFIVFSDQHKGAKDGADDFAVAEANYLAALTYYDDRRFHFISLGDNEEFWENSLADIKKNNSKSFDAEKRFIQRNAFTKIFGNHDLYWDNDPFADAQLKDIYGMDVAVHEAVVLETQINSVRYSIFCTHGHQGDSQSDGNWFSKFFVSNVWGPIQTYLRINPNLPSTNDRQKTLHNQLMYEWSAGQHNLLLITGHTHQPVFESLTHLETLYRKLEEAKRQQKGETVAALQAEIKLHGYAVQNFSEVRPTYFNSGCCCFDDGDITGIEIADGMIRLIKWEYKKSGMPERIVLEETLLSDLLLRLEK